MALAKAPNKPDKPENTGYSVPKGSKIPQSIAVAVNSGDPAKIAAVVAFHPSLAERSAIREYEAKMTRLDADLSVLLDVLDEANDDISNRFVQGEAHNFVSGDKVVTHKLLNSNDMTEP